MNETNFFISRSNQETKIAEDAITLDDYLTGAFSAEFFNGSWWSENELQWQDKVTP